MSNKPSFPFKTEAYVARPDDSTTHPDLEPIEYASLGPNQVLVSILAVSICHTDIRAMAGAFHLRPPMIPGHEGSGTVLATGSAVTDVREGDAVVLTYASCGKCRRCVTGKRSYCDEVFERNFGGSAEGLVKDGQGRDVKGAFFGQSSMSRVALVEESCCVKVDGLGKGELEICASLGCGIMTGAGAILNIAKPPPSSRIAIFGGGAVGLSALLAAKLSSPSLLVLIENSPTKLSQIDPSLLSGVTIVDSSTHKSPFDTANAIKALTSDRRGVDFALECIGNENVVVEAHAALDTLGTLVTVGSSATDRIGVLLAKHLIRGITIRGTHQGDSVSRVMVPYLIHLWKDGKFPFDQMIGKYDFEELGRAIDDVKEGKVVKPLLVV